HAVDPARQFVPDPDLEAVREPARVQFLVRSHHGGSDPAAIVGPVGAAAQDFAEGTVDRVTEAARAERTLEPPGYVQLVQLKDAARIGRPPQERILRPEPRKNTATVGFQQSLRAQVASHGDQADRIRSLRIEAQTSGHGIRSQAAYSLTLPSPPRSEGKVRRERQGSGSFVYPFSLPSP